MIILVCHNHYRRPGGEDQVFAAERRLLEAHGHRVAPYAVSNESLVRKGRLAGTASAIWNRAAGSALRRLIRGRRPGVVHFHNTFAAISPAGYYAAKREGLPVIQTLHNFRLLCPNAVFYRNGKVCEDCLGKAIPWPGVVHCCYHDSATHTGAVALMLTVHRALGTWTRMVDVYIALTEFARRKFIEGGLPAEKIVVKPNFVDPDPGQRTSAGNSAVFVGRLSPEKGVRTLLSAWQRLDGIPLRMVGDGPLRGELEETKMRNDIDAVALLGKRSREDVLDILKGSRFLVLPSECYENFPMSIAEAFACGVPVIASRLGAMAEIVEDGRTGLHFNPGDPEDLAAKVEWAWTHPERMAEMGREARREYERKYTAERNYEMLMGIYERAGAGR